jgi:[NiFe] hydrogenase diaphorase moiety small subunit
MNPSDDARRFRLDGREIGFEPGDTVLQAATRAGHFIPHLCWRPEFTPQGSCRLCSVRVDGRSAAACTTRAATGLEVQSNTDELNAHRKALLQLLFVEGNHFCPSCEKSGDCLLQATACEMGMEGLHFEALYPDRPVDASHPDILLDLNRCILCGLCVQASGQIDGKHVFALGGHGIGSHVVINSSSGRLGDTDMAKGDRAASICPVGAILPKRRGFSVPIGQRRFDTPTALQAPRKLKLATVSLAGCFGCHTSLLDIDERVFDLLERVEFDRSPLTDIKELGACDIGLVEGGVCNAENVQVLREFRARCKTLVAVGACATTGGLPAQRNHLDLEGLLVDVYRRRPGLSAGSAVPSDPELPLLLNKVRPIHELVHVDHFLPGCPPSAEAIWRFLTDLLAGRKPHLDKGSIHYD